MNTAVKITADKRNRLLNALKEVDELLRSEREVVGDDARKLVDVLVDEGRKLQKVSSTLIMALLYDHYTPADLFKPWASKKRITQWRDDPEVKLDVIIRHGRLCVKPTAFFAHWNTLKK